MATVINDLGPERYAQPCAGGAIGPHIRHCLDHLQALAAFLRQQCEFIDYEQRRRGWCGETDPQPAQQELLALAEQFLSYDGEFDHATPVVVRHIVDPDCAPACDDSSLGRETHFCLSHSVHHQALVAMLAQSLGLRVASDFGYAPSTIASTRTTP